MNMAIGQVWKFAIITYLKKYSYRAPIFNIFTNFHRSGVFFYLKDHYEVHLINQTELCTRKIKKLRKVTYIFFNLLK